MPHLRRNQEEVKMIEREDVQYPHALTDALMVTVIKLLNSGEQPDAVGIALGECMYGLLGGFDANGVEIRVFIDPDGFLNVLVRRPDGSEVEA